VVSKVSEEMTDVDFYYVDVNKSPELAEQFRIRSIPTMILLKNRGKEANRSVGFIPEDQVKEFAQS
jgi:thioredoxin 1